MLYSLNVILPVALIIFAGFIARNRKLIPAEASSLLMTYAQSFAVPLLLFNATRTLDLSSFQPKLYIAYYIPMAIAFGAGFFAARRAFHEPGGVASVYGFCAFFSNSVLLGLPICERAFGVESLSTNYALIAFHSPFGYIFGTSVMELTRRDGEPLHVAMIKIIKSLIKNPLLIGIFFGLLVNLAHIPFPQFAIDAVEMVSRSALPVALFGLGMVLAGLGSESTVRAMGARVMVLSAIRLGLHPLLVFLIGTWIALPAPMLASAIVVAAMPTGVNGFIFASLYKRDVDTAAATVFFSTVLSLLTIPFWLALARALLV